HRSAHRPRASRTRRHLDAERAARVCPWLAACRLIEVSTSKGEAHGASRLAEREGEGRTMTQSTWSHADWQRLEQAFATAVEIHKGQDRKGSPVPYLA